MKRRALLTFALVVVLLSGCSAAATARSALSQTAGDAASSARSAGLTLGLEANDRLIPGVLDTALTDAGDALGDAAKTLSEQTATGGIGAARDRLIADVRDAQDAVLAAQDSDSAGRLSRGEAARLSARLDALAQRLDASSKRLERG